MTDLCNEVERFGKGIGNTSRYRIVEALFRGPKTVSELVGTTGFSQPLVSQHLKILKSCELVTDERQGQEVRYALNTEYAVKLLHKLTQEMQKGKSH